jgi:hypothetical protein
MLVFFRLLSLTLLSCNALHSPGISFPFIQQVLNLC